ncbi:Methylenetetrahydrofolate--tRNA-(uracil-5-)-methyltransferase TrmFO OS=Lysinibacillus sphaericus CBAM5 OX=1400869 GN=gid PE=3 SV=1 [Lysinibacillus sphaericus]
MKMRSKLDFKKCQTVQHMVKLSVDRQEFVGNVSPAFTTIIDLQQETRKLRFPDAEESDMLASNALAEKIQGLSGLDYLYFYDAAAPIIEKDSIDMDKVYLKSRYDKGEAAYLNCPMTKEEFDRFRQA